MLAVAPLMSVPFSSTGSSRVPFPFAVTEKVGRLTCISSLSRWLGANACWHIDRKNGLVAGGRAMAIGYHYRKRRIVVRTAGGRRGVAATLVALGMSVPFFFHW